MSESASPNLLVIIDVDGTMIKNGMALRDPFYTAFREVIGKDIRGLTVNFAGRTDRGIIRDYFELVNVDGDFEELFTAFAERFCELVERDYPTHPDPRLLPGVIPLLDAISEHPDAALVLGTGNIRESCNIKLKRFDLLRYFPHLGGFGGEHELRADAIRAAMDVGREAYGWNGQAWVIGDTVNDAVAAHQVGAKALLTATGTISLAELQTSEAEFILPDLTDTSRILEILGLSS